CITPEGFTLWVERESSVMCNWHSNLNLPRNDVLVPTTFVSRIGMVVIAAEVLARGVKDDFMRDIGAIDTWNDVERKYIGVSAQEVCSAIFTHWSFDPLMAEIVSASEDPKTAKAEIQSYAYALKIVHTVVHPDGKITNDSSGLATKLAEEAKFDCSILLNAIEKVVEPDPDTLKD
ncbi:MAG: hypothetical protein QGH27_07745, partial [SAR324 cluster bacterium]|nr:hypothetical protein [SAR324 cluster bacterium]